MRLLSTAMNGIRSCTGVLVFVLFSLGTIAAIAQEYKPKTTEEVQVIAAVIRSEVLENKWTDKDVICFSIAGQDPSNELVKALRKQKLVVCSQGEWRRNLACRYAVFFLEPVTLNGSDSAHAKLESVDFQDVNTSSAHFPDRLRNGQYELKRTGGRWSVVAWTPAEVSKQK